MSTARGTLRGDRAADGRIELPLAAGETKHVRVRPHFSVNAVHFLIPATEGRADMAGLVYRGSSAVRYTCARIRQRASAGDPAVTIFSSRVAAYAVGAVLFTLPRPLRVLPQPEAPDPARESGMSMYGCAPGRVASGSTAGSRRTTATRRSCAPARHRAPSRHGNRPLPSIGVPPSAIDYRGLGRSSRRAFTETTMYGTRRAAVSCAGTSPIRAALVYGHCPAAIGRLAARHRTNGVVVESRRRRSPPAADRGRAIYLVDASRGRLTRRKIRRLGALLVIHGKRDRSYAVDGRRFHPREGDKRRCSSMARADDAATVGGPR
jgi:hypothetical protein